MTRTGSRRKIAGFTLPRSVSQNRKGTGLFGVGIDAEFGGCCDPALRAKGRELPHELRVVNAAARSDNFRSLRRESNYAACDRGRGESSRCCDEVFRGHGGQGADESLRRTVRAPRSWEEARPGNMGHAAIWSEAERSTCPRAAMRPARSKRCLPPVMPSTSWSITMLPGPVSKAMAFPPGESTVMLAIPPMLRATRWIVLMTEQQIVDEGNERRAFASRCYIACAELRHDGDSEALGDHVRFADLQRIRCAARALVINRLAVTADQLDRSDRHAAFDDGFGVELAEFEVQARDLLWSLRGENSFTQRRGVRRRVVCDRRDAARDIDDSDVDTVERGAAHDAGDSQSISRCRSSRKRSASTGRISSILSPRIFCLISSEPGSNMRI